MVIADILIWWYGAGWKHLVQRWTEAVRRIGLQFSVPLLARTLFAPWRRIISYGNESFIDGLKAALDNGVSRFVGFWVRVIVILTAGLLMCLLAVVGLIATLLWPLLPLLAIGFIVRGFL
jgi:hypothetical protein